jgi:uncharacterized tellurite resistance protein B-like protein
MITDINRFNESDCNARQQKIQQSNIYTEFSSKMKRRLKEQQRAAKNADIQQALAPK